MKNLVQYCNVSLIKLNFFKHIELIHRWLTSRTFCFWTRRLTVVRSWPTSSVTICDSMSISQPSISSTLCSYSTWRFASNKRSPFSVAVSSSSFHCLFNSSSLGSTIVARSGFSLLILSPSLMSFSSWSLLDLISDSNAYNEQIHVWCCLNIINRRNRREV